MSARKILGFSTTASLVAALCACSVTSSPAAKDANKPDAAADGSAAASAARPKTKPKTASLKVNAGPTPPANARSAGVQSRPKAGAVAVPITDVEVFTYQETFAEESAPATIQWAYLEGEGTYLWTSVAMTCADGSTDPEAAFLMEVKPDGTGSYLFSLPGCPSGDLFGCDFDEGGNDTACGACVVEQETLVCAVSS